jgi:glycosyltransferase involved in cell wall biosynthesis
MRVLHIISSLKIGGAEILLCDLIAELKQRGIQNWVIYFHDGPIKERLQAMNVSILQAKGAISLYDPVFFYRLARLIKKIDPDIIHSSLWAANFACRVLGYLLKCPVVSAVHLAVEYDGVIRNLLDSITMGLADTVITISETVDDSLKERKWLPANKIKLIKNGIGIKVPIRPFTRHDLSIPPSAFVIGCVGRFIPRKNHLLLIDAFAQLKRRLPNVVLMLIGFGPEEQHLRANAQKNGVSDAVLFIIGKPAIDYYQLFDCFVLPSKAEGLSIALLEAMASGLPVVVTGSRGIHPVITQGVEGLVIEPDDIQQLTESILRLVQDPSSRAQFAAAARNLFLAQYTSACMANQYYDLYNKMINFQQKI